MNEHESGNLRIEGALVVQRGQRILLGAACAEDAVRHAEVDKFEAHTNPDGYQRAPSDKRIRDVAAYYIGTDDGGLPTLMPNPILVNIREDDLDQVTIRATSAHSDAYSMAMESGGNWIGSGYIEIPRELCLWVYDGQHRVGGFREAAARLADFPMLLSITLGLPRQSEMREFHDVNTNAKSVPTDLAWQLLRNMAAHDPEFAEQLQASGRDWTNRGIDVVEELLKLNGPWESSIQLPNQKKERGDRLTITQAQFVRSLRPVMDMPLLASADDRTVASIINAYWAGIAHVLPEPFVSANSPKDYVIQKGPGAMAFHRVLPEVIEVARSRARGLGDPATYADVLERLPALRGEVYDDEGVPNEVSGADFWLSGPAGVASQFTGDSGRRRLMVRIRALLPKPTVEVSL